MQVNDKCPSDAMAWLWAYNKPVLDELRIVMEPLAEELSAYVEADVGTNDGVARETLATRVQHGIPFGIPYTLLPPRLFGSLHEEAKTPQLPSDEPEAYQLVASYWERRHQPPLPGMPEGSYTFTHEDRLGELLDDLLWMMQRGVEIDPVKWEQYRHAGREQARHGRYDLDLISTSRGNSIKSLYHYPALARLIDTCATGSFEHFMAMPTTALDVDGHSFGLLPAGYLFMPEGACGPHFNEKLLRTTAYMINSAQQVLGGKALQLAQSHPDIVVKHTTRARDGRKLDASLVSTVQEGARSSMEVVALLMADEVPGYDDPDQLFNAIVEQGIIEEFTRAIPMGMLGPLLFTGKYFPKLLLNKGGGKLALSPLIMSEIKQVKRAMALQDLADWMLYWSTPEDARKDMLPPVATALICPAALPHGALTQMAHSTLGAFKAFRFDP